MSIRAATLTLSAVWLACELNLARSSRSKPADRKLDRSSLQVIWLAVAVSVVTGIYVGSKSYGHFGSGSRLIPVIGLAVMLSGIAVRMLAIHTLQHRFTIDGAIAPDHHLVTGGVYHYLRHPSYAGSLLAFVGLGLTFSNYLSLVAVLIPIGAAFLY